MELKEPAQTPTQQPSPPVIILNGIERGYNPLIQKLQDVTIILNGIERKCFIKCVRRTQAEIILNGIESTCSG